MSFFATYYGSSGWLIQFGGYRVLIDPWLTGSLSFPPGKWLLEGKLRNEYKVPDSLNLLLLTQGLADHAHIPSLNLLPRATKVIASPSAALLVKKLGFEDVQEITPGNFIQLEEITIQATPGAAVPNIENGYILTHPKGSLYIEPHGFFDEKTSYQKVDSVITPVVNLKLPLVGNIINGKSILPILIDKLKPINILSSTTGGDVEFTGLLNRFISSEGTIEEARKSIYGKASFIDPIPGTRYELETS